MPESSFLSFAREWAERKGGLLPDRMTLDFAAGSLQIETGAESRVEPCEGLCGLKADILAVLGFEDVACDDVAELVAGYMAGEIGPEEYSRRLHGGEISYFRYLLYVTKIVALKLKEEEENGEQ